MNNVKKSIGWADWTINPVKGLCPVGCSYCYARRIYKRYKWDETIRYDDSVWSQLSQAKDGDRIFVGSTIDPFHPECGAWIDLILGYCILHPKLTFIFLTKCPENLPKEFPDNCWVGVSATGYHDLIFRLAFLEGVSAKVKFVSFEPLLNDICIEDIAPDFKKAGINWVIIGQQTPVSQKTSPKIEWVKEIVDAADSAKIPVFLKNNLNPIFAANDCALYRKYKDTFFRFKDFLDDGRTSWHLRQEIPAER